jgi:class 3 adenylate cyclase
VVDIPDTKYTRLGESRIAYQVLGEGPIDLLFMSNRAVGSIDMRWEWAPYASFLRRLASFARLIAFDCRGVGASDPVDLESLPTWEEWAADARAVLDAVGSDGVAVCAATDVVPIAVLFAATQPHRARALILFNGAARFITAPDHPWGLTESEFDRANATLVEVYGTEVYASLTHPGADREFARWVAKAARLSMRPREYVAYMKALKAVDLRPLLSSIRVPTLVMHRQNPSYVTVAQGQDLAERIPGARFVVVPGSDSDIFARPTTQLLGHIEEFLTGTSPRAEADRVLAALLFTDIVGSTQRAASLGDRWWRNLLDSHDAVSRAVVEEHGGRWVKSTGDGVLATFDGPGRAIRSALALRDALHPLGVEIRAGLHTGEVELRGDDIGGIGVHVAARVLDCAAPGEVLVSSVIPLLVAGSGIDFEDRGEHELKGVPGAWRLFAVEA